MRVMCAMSGGVDSSVTALAAEGGRPRGGRRDDEAVGRRQRHRLLLGQRRRRRPPGRAAARHRPPRVQLRRRVRRANVVEPYVAAHAAGTTPNPCIECNRSVKFARLAERADLLGFDAIATGHHARVGRDRRRAVHDRTRRRPGQGPELRGAHARPGPAGAHDVPGRRPAEVAGPRAGALAIDLRTADKPDSQDVCFIMSTSGGRTTFLGDRIPFHRARRRRHRAAPASARSRRSSWSRSASARASACPAADRSATSSTSTPTQRVVTVGDEADMLRPASTSTS